MAEKSGTSIISLPQGGGALKGIGETFAPDLFTGTGNFSVPIALPPGRNGFQPDLSLVYSTGNGNSPFGLGWGLSVPGVSRKTSRGIPRYDDATDVFILSGSEDLVPVSGELPGELQYRPRTEGLFALITFRRDIDTNDSFWEVRSKVGLVSRYGTPGLADNDPATVANPADVSRVFAWKLTQTVDPFGNRIEYEYERDRGEEGPHHWDQLYLKQIRYVDFDDHEIGEERFLITVTFYYEERPDPFSDYRAGFEIRTRKRCKEIVVETHPSRHKRIRVRTYVLTYLDELVAEDGLPPNRVSLLSQIRVIGHDDDQLLEADRTQELPPLEFGYTKFEPQSRKFSPVAGADLPAGSLGDPTLELASLFGNGLTDIFEMNGTVRYWRNLGGGAFDRPREMRDAPAGLALADPGVQLIDANGDGRADLMVTSAPLAGYFPLTFSGAWDRRSFQRYRSAPSFDLEDPEVKLVDLDGDGVTDAIRSGSRFECFFNDPKEGWTRTRQVERRSLEDFPNVSFSDPRIKWADMSGDGLQNIVLVHDGHIDYWPNLGYGEWGKRVSMRNSPRFPYGYDPKRILLGDIDGDGPADLLYVDDHKVTLWINQSGNAWSAPIEIRGTPGVSDMDSVRLDDLQGTGIAGVLWSGVFSAPGRPHMFFLDLTGGTKPYLLNEMNNSMGAVTRVRYAASTELYLADQRKPATRWRTTLPFPVQVVAAVEVTDEISGGKLTTEYIYHHGYWDGGDREFRGFGRVDQRDTEVFDDYNSTGLHTERQFEFVPKKAFSPPTETRTWFHLGPVGEEYGPWDELDLSQEYWSGDPPMAVVGKPNEVVLQRLRDAVRALRGRILRTELYALDGSEREDRPYTVIEFAYGLREEDPPDGDTQGERLRIFFPHALGQRTTQWERGDDPMTSFSFTDGYDEVGQPRLQTQIACPRGWRRPEDAPTESHLATHSRADYARPVDPDVYIMDRVARMTSFEVPETGGKTVQEVKDQAASGSKLRVIGQVLNYYDGPAFVGRAFSEVGAFGVLVRSENLVLTEEIMREAYNPFSEKGNPSTEIPPYLVTGTDPPWTDEYPEEFRSLLPPLAGYVFQVGDDSYERGYFAAARRNAYDFHLAADGSGRGLLRVTRDPLGFELGNRDTVINYDEAFNLLPVKVSDPAGLETVVDEYDLRLLLPSLVQDRNDNRTRFSYTALGLLRDIAVLAKEGEIGDIREGPNGREIVPGTVFAYDLLAFFERGEPIHVSTIRREYHASDTGAPTTQRDATIKMVEFSDGFGRLLQIRTQAEDVLFGDASFGGGLLPLDQRVRPGPVVGRPRLPEEPENVVVSGWQAYDNKGRVVQKFEPFFAFGFDYAPPEATQFGQRATLFYDPRGQVIHTVNPDGSERRVVFGLPGSIDAPDLSNPAVFEPTPWEAFTYDENDNAGRIHEDSSSAYADHRNTPASIRVDALGRTVESIERNGGDPEADWFRIKFRYDIRGNVLEVRDALDRPAFRYVHDVANKALRTVSIDAGLRRVIFDAGGTPIESRDGRGALVLHCCDVLNRPLRLWARDGKGEVLTLRERFIYGDQADAGLSETEARTANLCGALFKHYDEAGLLAIESYDFKGNILEKVRRVVSDEAMLGASFPSDDSAAEPIRIDWGVADVKTTEAELLDPREHRTSMTYDALARLKSLQYPEDTDGERKTLRPTYNRAGALEQVELEGKVYVEHIAYDAKGQRTFIALGNGVMTRYCYDPATFRLKRLYSERYVKLPIDPPTFENQGDPLQDLAYIHDLVGNILTICERTPGSGVQDNPQAASVADPELARLLAAGDALIRTFTYDPIYRLISANGRKCKNGTGGDPWTDNGRCGFNSGNHGTPDQDSAPNLTRLYTETYRYDPVGNMQQLKLRTNGSGFTRGFVTVPGSNRLATSTIGTAPDNTVYAYVYDENGNMVRETVSRHSLWDHADRMKAFRVEDGAGGASVHAHYLYDSGGMRVKKLVRKSGGLFESTTYVDDLFELHRWQLNGLGAGENSQLHIADGEKRIATKRVGEVVHPDDKGPAVQVQLSDRIGSSNVVIGADGVFINREEYTPYGESSFGSFARKRYRFSGKERDEETGLYYHETRYYAAWLGRWIGCDPAYLADGSNLFAFVRGNPVRLQDPGGTESVDPDGVVRKPGTTQGAIVQSKGGYKFLALPETSLAIDPAFKAIAEEVRAGMRSNSYESFRRTLNERIKGILQGTDQHSLKNILEVKGNKLFWKAGTAYAGQELNYAHTIAQKSIQNLGASEGATVALENLAPVGRKYHLEELGHIEEIATSYMKTATAEAQAGTKLAADEIALVRRGGGQAGFATVGGLFFALIAVGATIYAIGRAQNKPQEIVKLGADLAIAGVLVRISGSVGIGVVASMAIGMHSDSAAMNAQYEEEERKNEIAKDFIRARIPSAVEEHWYGDKFDPTVLKEAKHLLFETKPTVFSNR